METNTPLSLPSAWYTRCTCLNSPYSPASEFAVHLWVTRRKNPTLGEISSIFVTARFSPRNSPLLTPIPVLVSHTSLVLVEAWLHAVACGWGAGGGVWHVTLDLLFSSGWRAGGGGGGMMTRKTKGRKVWLCMCADESGMSVPPLGAPCFGVYAPGRWGGGFGMLPEGIAV